MAKNPYLSYVAPKAGALDTMQAIIEQVGGGATVTYTSKGAGGSLQKFVIAPADVVAGQSKVEQILSPEVPRAEPGFLQTIKPDGSIGPNWVRISLLGVAALAVAGAVVSAAGRRRR
jgi:hypothetical protein